MMRGHFRLEGQLELRQLEDGHGGWDCLISDGRSLWGAIRVKNRLASFRAKNFPMRAETELDFKMFRCKPKIRLRSVRHMFRNELNVRSTHKRSRRELIAHTLVRNPIRTSRLNETARTTTQQKEREEVGETG